MHAGEEGVAPRRAALLGVVSHENRTLITDAINVGSFPDHEAAVIDARLHNADVITHDEEDIGLLLRRCGCAVSEHADTQSKHNGVDEFMDTHRLLPPGDQISGEAKRRAS